MAYVFKRHFFSGMHGFSPERQASGKARFRQMPFLRRAVRELLRNMPEYLRSLRPGVLGALRFCQGAEAPFRRAAMRALCSAEDPERGETRKERTSEGSRTPPGTRTEQNGSRLKGRSPEGGAFRPARKAYYLFMASATATATATVAPTMGLLPMPRKPIISTWAGTELEPANCASECIRPMVSVMP